jgi:signal transduction histidine kinase
VLGGQMTDPTLIRIILQNLFANAIKYTPKWWKITCILQKHKNNIVIQVVDTGCGIPLSARKEIFHKFFRAENVRDTKWTGLGLYIVKSMVEKLQGSISFETVCVDEKKRWKTAGTTFTVKLPFITKKSS